MSGILDALGFGYDVFKDIFSFNYQKNVQQETWNREDTAVQRRVADLKAAGLSPVLAAGQGAQTSAPVGFGMPHGDPAGKAAMIAKARTDISATRAQQELLKQQARKSEAEANILEQTQQDKVMQEKIATTIATETMTDEIMSVAYKAGSAAYKLNMDRVEAAVKEAYGLLNASYESAILSARAEIERKYRLGQEEQRLVELIYAAKAAKYNYDWASSKGYPVGSIDMFNRAIGTVGELVGRGWDWIDRLMKGGR